jgi:hypothetical protein
MVYKDTGEPVPASSSSSRDTPALPATISLPPTNTVPGSESAADTLIRLRAEALGGDARAAWNAFQIADLCATPEREQRALHDLPVGMFTTLRASLEPEAEANAKLCLGVTGLQRDERRTYLIIAADGGVPGAAAALFDFGPADHASDEDPVDPEVRTWNEHTLALLRRDADRGDFGALTALQAVYQYGGIAAVDATQALTYELAVEGLMASDTKFVPAELDLHRESISRIQSLLSADERIAAEAAAANLLSRWGKPAVQSISQRTDANQPPVAVTRPDQAR